MRLLLVVFGVCLLVSCKKSTDAVEEPPVKDHFVVLKVATNPQAFFSTGTYTEGSGKMETFTNTARLSNWSSQQLTVPATAKTISFSAVAGALNNNQFYLNVEIWVDGVKSAEGKTTTVSQGLMKASATYSF